MFKAVGQGLETSAGIRSSGVNHMLEDMDISYFDKVKSLTPASRGKASFSKPWDKNPSQDCKFWGVDRIHTPLNDVCQCDMGFVTLLVVPTVSHSVP